MATTLYFRNQGDTPADTHRGTNTAKRDGVATGWRSLALATTRGSGLGAQQGATVTGATNGVEVRVSSTEQYEWLSPPVAADVTISGTITANIWGSENNMSANVAINVIIDIVRATTSGADASNTIQNIVQSTNVAELAVTTSGVNNFTSGMTSGAYTGQTVNRGDRLRIRIIGDDAGVMATGFTFGSYVGGTTAAADGDSYVTFTENLTFESAPGVSDQMTGGNNHGVGNTTTGQKTAHPFVAAGTSLTSVRLELWKTGAPTDDLVITVETDASGAPSGSSVGTVATVNGTALTTTATQYTYSPSISLTSGVTYWLVLSRSGALSATDLYQVRTSSGAVSGWTSCSRYNGSAWSAFGTVVTARLEMTPFALYLTDTASAVLTASQDLEAWTSRGSGVVTSVTNTAAGWTAPIQATTTAGGTVIDWFTRPLTAFTLTGMAVADIRALESNASANASLRCEIARVEGDGTSPTVWASWCCAPTGTDNGELTTSEVARTINLSGDDLAITNGQRLRFRLYNEDSSAAAMAATYTVTRYYAGTSGGASGDTYVTFPQTLTEYASGPFTYTKAGYGRESA